MGFTNVGKEGMKSIFSAKNILFHSFTWEYARFTIRKLCRNDREYTACTNSLVFKKASDIEEGRK